MSGLLTKPRVKDLGGGWSLRLLSAREELEARAEGEALASDERDRALCANACLLSRALLKRGKSCFDSGRAVLEALTAGQIADMARRWGEFDRACNPSALEKETVDEAKKAWSARLMSAFSGACSAHSARFPRKSGPER